MRTDKKCRVFGDGSRTSRNPIRGLAALAHRVVGRRLLLGVRHVCSTRGLGTIVDMQWPGFEPVIQIDSQDRFYTSVLYGSCDMQSFLCCSEDHGNDTHLVLAAIGMGKTPTCEGASDFELALVTTCSLVTCRV